MARIPLRSEYINADVPAGQVIEGIRHEDLQRTTFNDEAFDLVLSSDVRGTGHSLLPVACRRLSGCTTL